MLRKMKEIYNGSQTCVTKAVVFLQGVYAAVGEDVIKFF